MLALPFMCWYFHSSQLEHGGQWEIWTLGNSINSRMLYHWANWPRRGRALETPCAYCLICPEYITLMIGFRLRKFLKPRTLTSVGHHDYALVAVAGRTNCKITAYTFNYIYSYFHIYEYADLRWPFAASPIWLLTPEFNVAHLPLL